MDLKEIRRIVIIALFSDDELMGEFVLKGGNALDIVYEVGARSSVDIDISMAGDFQDVENAKERIFRSLRERFDAAGFVVFDATFRPKPSVIKEGREKRWGGYLVEFKIVERDEYERHRADLESLRRRSYVLGPAEKRKFRIDISKNEFCHPNNEVEIDHFTVYVYTLPMLAIEKLRAICQQMDKYSLRRNPTPRARDFYDIHAIITSSCTDLTTSENLELLENIFAAKDVPLSLLADIEDTRDFHATDWLAVKQSVSGNVEDFDYYFRFVLNEVRKLESLWIK